MKIQKLSIAIAFSAALAAGVVAQSNNNKNKNHPAPTQHRNAPTSHNTHAATRSATAAHTFQHNNSSSLGHQNSTSSGIKANGQTTHPTPGSFGQRNNASFGNKTQTQSNNNTGFGNHTRTRGNSRVTGQSTAQTNVNGGMTMHPGTRQGNNNTGNNNHTGVRKAGGFGTPPPIAQVGKGPLTGAAVHTGHPVPGHPGVFAVHHAPPVQPGVNAPPKTAFRNPSAPVSTHNYPAPPTGNTYITNNTTIINNNYNIDSRRYSPHVSNFYGYQDPSWGGHWRYGCVERPGITVSFGFGAYVYTPFYASCVASPWYYYPSVPAYIPQDRVIVVSGYNCDWSAGDVYDYRADVSFTTYGVPNLNHGVDSIRRVFVDGNVDALNNNLGGNQIAIFSEGNYEYSLNRDDFRQMLADNVSATQTQSFEITRVRRYGIHAVIEAAHTFAKADGGTDTVYQRWRLQMNTDGSYVVTDFMTSHEPFSRGGYRGSNF